MSRFLMKLVNKCHSLKSLKSIHAHLVTSGSITSSDLALNKILRLYSRFGATSSTRQLFDEIPQPNAFLWTALTHGFVENRQYHDAVSAFIQMRGEIFELLNFAVASVLKALARLKKVKEGEVVYGLVWKCGFAEDLMVQNAVIDLFMRCGVVGLAMRVFDEMKERDVVTWNSMISGYGGNGRIDIARRVFDGMKERNVISWTSMIQAYVKDGNMSEAMDLFRMMPEKDVAVWNVILSGYVDVGDIVAAQCVFDAMPVHEIGSWNLMILGLCKAGDVAAAKELFDGMPNRNVMSWVMMIDGYMKFGDVDRARGLFDEMPEKNLVAWSTMIDGYAKRGKPCDALGLCKCFKNRGLKPDETFILSAISACSQLGILNVAESVIKDFVGPTLMSNLQVITSLIDMYAKCGSIEKAAEVFETVGHKDLLCYSTMITAFANHGLCQDAICLFREMETAKIKPDGVAFLGVLTACNHGGLVDKGRGFFRRMIHEYGIQPTEKHYACLVDLLGRAGCLEEAHCLVKNMPISPSAAIWGALLAACRVHRNLELAEVAAVELFKIEPDNSGGYVLLSSIYADSGRWDGVAKVRAMIRDNHILKNKGSSWIELGCMVHEFVMRDASHGDAESIHLILDLLGKDVKSQSNFKDSEEKELLPVFAP